jgi:hypothetical protein
MVQTGFINSFTSGEIAEDAWDRNDIQPITKGCEEAANLIIRIAGPLGKRRGFWRLGNVADQTKLARLIPFRRSIDDALMLEFGDTIARVWSADGSPLIDPGTGLQAQFATPYTQAQLAGLRYKQVADVIYFRHNTGLPPQALQRDSDTSWAFNVETFPNGPWLAENANAAQTITVAGDSEEDANPHLTGASGTMLPGTAVTLTTALAAFDPAMVGATFRIRQGTGAASVKTWSTGYRPPAGEYCASAGLVYRCTTPGTGALTSGVDEYVTTPPVQTSGDQSDGSNLWTYRHDGAGVVQITAVTSATEATGVVLAGVPLVDGQSTPCFSECAYSAYRGWPRMWPSVVEERLVDGATRNNLDMFDMTETAGFDPVSQTFTPGLGTGAVVDTDAIRRRVGADGAQILWSMQATFLLLGTASGEYIVSGGLFGEPVTPATVVVRDLSSYGSEDVYPVKAHQGLMFVTRGGQCIRKCQVDVQQNLERDDYTFLASHIAVRRFAQLAWVPYPDEVLWTRLGDGGLAAMTFHEEQQVRGWTRQQIPGGFIVEDIVTLPGPGRLETLWMIVSRVQGGVTQRMLWMQSQASDGLFIDGAEYYDGAPTAAVGGLAHYTGETVRVVADGAQYDLACVGGSVTLPTAASIVQVGLGFKTCFRSLTLDLGQMAAALNLRQRPTQIVARLKTSVARVGVAGGLLERVSTRTAQDVPAAVSRSAIVQATVAVGTSRDPRIAIEEDTAYDHVIYSLKPTVAVGG